MKSTALSSMLLFAFLMLANQLLAANYYWVHPGTASANWSDVANWRTTSGGVTTHATPPTAADNVFFDGNSFAAAGRTVVVDVAAVCANMIWTGATNAPTLTINNPLTIHGNLTFIAGMTVNGTGVVTFTGANPQTITMAGKVFGGNVLWTKDAGSTATLAGAFATNGAFILQQDGNLNSANQNINCQRFEMINVGTANMGTSTIQITGASNTPPSLDLSGGGIINVATATWNFSNTTSGATTRIVLGDNARNNGNITVAGAAALKNVIMEGSENHQIVALNIGNNVNFSQSTAGFDYTYSSITVAASTVAGAGVNFESTTTVTGTTTVGNLNAVTFKGGNTNLTGAVSFGNGNTVSFQNTGTVTFGSTLVLTATAPTTPSSTLTFANTVSNVSHAGTVTLGGTAGSTIQYNNTGTVTFSGQTNLTDATGANFNNLTFANSVTTVTHSQAVNYGARANVTYNNTGNTTFNNNLTGGNSNTVQFNNAGTVSVTGTTNFASGAAPATSVTFTNMVSNVTHTGNATFGGTAGSIVQYNNTGTVSFNGTTTLTNATAPANNNLTFANSVTTVTHSQAVNYGARANVTYNNTGNTTFNNNLTGGNSNTVQFNNAGTVSVTGTTNFASGAAPATSVTFTNTVSNVTHTGNATFGGNNGINVNYGNTGTVTFSGTTTINNATSPNFNTITFGNTVTNVLHNNNVTINNRGVLNYNNTGFVNVGTSPANRNFAISGTGSSVTLGTSVTTFSVTGNTNLGSGNTVTLDNSGSVFLGDGAGDTFTSGNGTTFNVGIGGAGKNFTISGNATFGTASAVSINNSGNTSINGNLIYNGSGSNFQYGNGGTVSFGGTVTANGITGTLSVQFTNGNNTTYNGAVTLTTATGAGNSITYLFAGGQTANINANFTITGACDNLITVGITGSGSATLNLTATPANRNWVRVNVSNIDASSVANNIRAYAYTDGGGNSGIDFRNNSTSANRTLYWVAGGPQAGTNTLWSNANNWSFEPNEFIPAVCIPTVDDSVVFGHDDISFSATNATVDVDGDYAVAGMRWSATDVTPVNPILRSVGGATRTLTIAGAFDSYRAAGTITFQNQSPTQRLNFTFTGARRTPANGWNEIRSGGVNFPREVVFNGNADNTRWRLIDNFSARIDAGADPSNNGSVYLQRGVFDTQEHDLIIGRFNANQYVANFTSPRELIISGASHWTIQGRSGNVTAGSLPVAQPPAIDLGGNGFTFNSPHPASYWYFSGANNDSTAVTEGAWVIIRLGRGANVPREVPNIGVGYRHTDIDILVDAQPTPFNFRELRLSNTPPPANRQIYIQTWNDNNTQLIFKGLVDFGNNTNVNPNNNVGTVIRGPHTVAPDPTWSNISRFEKAVIIGNNSRIPFWGNFRFDGPITVGELSRVWFSRNGGGELIAPAGNRYRFNDDVTLGKASIAYFYANVDWPVAGKTLSIGEDALAYVGDVPSTITPPTEYGINNWQNIVLGHQGRLILNNGEGTGTSVNNRIVNLTFGEFSVVELNTEVNTTNASATPRTRITGTMSSSFTGVCSSWATLRSVVDGKQADLIVNSAQTVNALVVKDVNVVENVPGIDLTVNAGADAGNNSGSSSLLFTGARTGRNFYWVGGTNKDKTTNPFRKAIDTNYDGTPDDNGDNVVWSNPVNWYSEDGSLPRRTTLTAAMITSHNQCVPTIIDNVYFLDDSFKGGNNTGNIFQNRRNVLVDIPQAQARNFEWYITTAAFTTSGNTGAGFNADCTACGGPVRFTNEQQPILPTTEIQIAGNLRWAAPGGTLSIGIGVTETVLRNDFIARFSFIGSGTPHSGPGTGPTTHTIESNGQRFAGEVMFDNRYSTWTPLDAMDLNSHQHASSYPVPPAMLPGGATAWSRASIIINQGALDMSVATPKRINLEGDWTISGLFDHAHFDASTSEVVFDGSGNGGANANNANIIMHENIRVPAPNQPVNSPADDPNRDYDPTRRRFYDLTVNKRQNDWDVRVLNSPVSVLRNIYVQQGRLWDNDEGGSVPMQIKGKLSGTGTFRMDGGTLLNLGSNSNSGADNRYGAPTYNWGTEFPAAVNGYPTTFPLGYTKADITLASTSTVRYWQNGHQNVSIVPDYGNIEFVGHSAPTDFATNWGNLRKRHLIREDITGNVNYAAGNHAPGSASVPVFTPTNGGTLTVQGNWTQNGGIDFLDNGNQINLTGATPTLTVGAWAILTLGSGLDALSLDALNRTLPLVNHATTFPTGTPTLALDANSIVNYNAGTDQEVRGLNGAGNASYGHLMIANRDRSIAAPLPSLARKTLSAATTVRGQLRIYPNAHLIDNGNQITMTPGGRLHMYRVLPAVDNGTAAANINGLLDLYDLRTLVTTNGVATGSHHTMINSESRLTLGNATTATTFPTNVPQANLFLQNRTTIVYNAGVDQQIRQLATTDIATFADSVTLYANLVLINPTATLRTKTITGTTAAVVTSTTNPAPSPASNNTVRGDLTIGANNTLADNGYQLHSHDNATLQQRFNMFVLKSSTDSYVPTFSNTGLPATFSMNNTVNVSAANGISRILMGTGTVSSVFPINFRGANDAEINFEVAATLPTPLYSQQVYNGGRAQNVAGLNQNISNRIYGHLIFTNPLAVPVGPTPKVLQANTRVRGSIIINPNNNFLDNGRTITMTPSASSVVRLQMFSTNAAASTALDANGINPVSGADGGSYFTIGTAGTATTLPAGFPAYNNTHLNLQTGTTIVYASGVAQNIRPLHTGTATDNANYANLWLLDRETGAVTGSPIVKTVNTPGAGTWPTQVTVRGSLFIGQNNNLFDNGFQINGVSGQPFRMFLDRTVMATASGSPAIWQSITGGNNLYGGGTATPAVRNGASVLTLGNATIATEFPLNYADADIDLATYGMAAAQSTTVRYNAGVNQNIRGLFNATPTANNNYANVEIINSAAAGNSVKTLQGNTRIRGNLYIGGGVNANRNTTLVATASNQANTLAVGTNNINIQGHWVVFGSNTRATFDGVSTFSTANHTINNLFTSGTGTVTFEGNGRAQVVASGSIVTGTGSGFTETVSNRFYHVVIDKGTAGTVNGRTVYLREDPMLVQQTVTFTNGFFWSNADGTENGGTPNRQDDDNQLTFLNNPGVIQVLGPGTFAGAQGPHNNSYVVGAVRKIGTSATAASAVGGANTFDFPIGHTPFVTGLLPDSWLGRGYYYAPSGVLDLTANHDFVSRYYGTNANLAGATIPAGIRPQDLTNPGAGNHFPTNVKAASLRFINESEFWTIDYSSKVGPATPSGLPFRAKLSWDSNPNRTAVNTTFSAAPLKVAHWTNKGSGLMWYDESRSAALGTEVDGRGVQVSVSTTYNGPFNNADDAVSILPIELVSFSARAVEVEGDGGKVEVTWQTAWERDNDYFEVEKSRDGINFQSIARVEPKGNNGFSNSIQHYVHYDEQPWLGKNYYRLKQVDFDGTTTYSKIEVVIFERNALAPTAGNMEVYPNPFESNSQTLKVVLPQGGVGAGWLVVWDMAGREMYRERIEEGQTQLEITPNETQGKLAHGAYIIRAIGRDKAFTAKVVVE
jgi:hypothetical protein